MKIDLSKTMISPSALVIDLSVDGIIRRKTPPVSGNFIILDAGGDYLLIDAGADKILLS